METIKTIAVDFDGTIVENAYPGIGKPMLFAFDTLKKLQQEGNRLILWTYRSGARLDEAVQFCADNGITFYAINKSYPEEVLSEDISRKINADIFIDDRDVRGMMGWGEIYQILGSSDEKSPSLKQKRSKPARKQSKKSFMSRIEELFKDENA
ncbi:BT0820 family HAD-type phosphatase [Dokdonia sp. R86516]|uniref:BT0820 family HAD-type phosphatase n=1 Tax=Dokdonia sp. R86516 TaxID=3093856 RepID=UPI0037C7F4DB